MAKKNAKYTTKTEIISKYDLEGSLDECIKTLQDIRERYRPYNDVSISFDLDYSSCYYAGDTPSIEIEVRGTAPCTN